MKTEVATALVRMAEEGLVSTPSRKSISVDYEPVVVEGTSLSETVIADRRDRL